ncbi:MULTISPECIES: hypothetical protein [unclassified Okeania]|nr:MULTISPECIES: hypothetical protein [unclassified Okeania]NET20719.1 hypothetical protein [Okeania sp. SIO1H5]NET94332.1 hypothetical protein [Okeania sp. SIO1H2]
MNNKSNRIFTEVFLHLIYGKQPFAPTSNLPMEIIMSNQKHRLINQAILGIATTFGLFSASVANAASLNVLWYGQTDAYNAKISE